MTLNLLSVVCVCVWHLCMVQHQEQFTLFNVLNSISIFMSTKNHIISYILEICLACASISRALFAAACVYTKSISINILSKRIKRLKIAGSLSI